MFPDHEGVGVRARTRHSQGGIPGPGTGFVTGTSGNAGFCPFPERQRRHVGLDRAEFHRRRGHRVQRYRRRRRTEVQYRRGHHLEICFARESGEGGWSGLPAFGNPVTVRRARAKRDPLTVSPWARQCLEPTGVGGQHRAGRMHGSCLEIRLRVASGDRGVSDGRLSRTCRKRSCDRGDGSAAFRPPRNAATPDRDEATESSSRQRYAVPVAQRRDERDHRESPA